MSGYSNSVNAILKVKEYLDVLVNSNTSFEWSVSEPQKFAYQLREAFKVAKQYKDQYPEYAKLSEKFTIRVTRRTVFAQLKDVLEIQPISLGKVTLSNLRSPMEIVGAALMHNAPIMHFPDASIAPEDFDKLKAWSEVSDYSCNIANGNHGIMLNRK
jgi:hypothetical protein